MKKISKLLSIVLCLAMLMGLAVAVSAAETDLSGTYIIGDYDDEGTQIAGKCPSETATYGYMYDDYTVEEQHERTQYTISLVSDGKYTIVDCYGRYLGVSGTYKSFQLYTENQGDNCLWTITEGTDGEYVVQNVSNGRMIDYSAGYSSFGVYLESELPDDGQICLVSLNAEEPEVTVNYYVAGVSELCGSFWTADDANNIMTQGEDGLYTKVYENVAAGSYELKVTDGTWDASWGNGNDNYSFTIEAVSTVTVTFDAETKTVSVESEAVETVTTVTVADGDYVIYAPAYNMALSSTYSGYYNAGVEVSVVDGELTGYAETEVWTITNNDDGTICISINGQNLAMADSFSSLTLGEINDKWIVVDAGDGLVYIQNVARECYIEWYANKSNWSGFAYINEGSEGMFALELVPLNEEVETPDEETPDEETPDEETPDEETPDENETPDDGNTGVEENPTTGDMTVAGLVVAMMAATAGAVVISKKKF